MSVCQRRCTVAYEVLAVSPFASSAVLSNVRTKKTSSSGSQLRSPSRIREKSVAATPRAHLGQRHDLHRKGMRTSSPVCLLVSGRCHASWMQAWDDFGRSISSCFGKVPFPFQSSRSRVFSSFSPSMPTGSAGRGANNGSSRPSRVSCLSGGSRPY